MISADDIRGIIDRAVAARVSGVDQRDATAVQRVLDDRAVLLTLLRRVADTSPIINVIQGGVCEMCGRIIEPDSDRPPEGHGPDCPAPVLVALLPPEHLPPAAPAATEAP